MLKHIFVCFCTSFIGLYLHRLIGKHFEPASLIASDFKLNSHLLKNC